MEMNESSMKKLARKGLSLVASFLMVLSAFTTEFAATAHATEITQKDNHIWTKVNLGEISADDSIAITMKTSDGKTFVLPNAQSSSAPKAVLGSVSADGKSLTIAEDIRSRSPLSSAVRILYNIFGSPVTREVHSA